jgi:hypothetical protein
MTHPLSQLLVQELSWKRDLPMVSAPIDIDEHYPFWFLCQDNEVGIPQSPCTNPCLWFVEAFYKTGEVLFPPYPVHRSIVVLGLMAQLDQHNDYYDVSPSWHSPIVK